MIDMRPYNRMHEFYTKEIQSLKIKLEELKKELRSELENMGYDHPNFTLGFWGWDCPHSPIGKCIYNDWTDPDHDNCVICGDTSERK